MATINQQAGVVKRKAKSEVKKLVAYYVDNGIYENFGVREANRIMGNVPQGLGYQEQQTVREEIRDLFSTTNNLLFANGRGNTSNRKVRQELAHRALNYIENFEWKK